MTIKEHNDYMGWKPLGQKRGRHGKQGRNPSALYLMMGMGATVFLFLIISFGHHAQVDFPDSSQYLDKDGQVLVVVHLVRNFQGHRG